MGEEDARAALRLRLAEAEARWATAPENMDGYDRGDAILDALLADPAVLFTALRGERLRYQFLQGDNVWRFPRSEGTDTDG
jgi:hypothetical protein